MNSIVVFDTETTGLKPETDEVLQIAVVEIDFDYNILFQQSMLLNVKCDINPKAQAVHGISKEMLVNQPFLGEPATHELLNKLQTANILSGHNIKFDIGFLKPYCNPDATIFDTLPLARTMYAKGTPSELPNHRLETLQRVLQLPVRDSHDALSDVLTCIDFMKHLEALNLSLAEQIDASQHGLDRQGDAYVKKFANEGDFQALMDALK